MSRRFYCAECGKLLTVTRKAPPKYATIIDIVEVHKCSKEPIEFDLQPVDTPFKPVKDKQKFVQKLNDLNSISKSSIGSISTEDLRDRRFEPGPELTKLRTDLSAPQSIANMVKDIETKLESEV